MRDKVIVPCHFKLVEGVSIKGNFYCGKPSSPNSNYCKKHGTIVKAQYAKLT